ncbi:MAG: hypothetical protein RIB65_00090 [Ilumatobacter fluminis]|jgi:hypothetical protein|uniref:Uncharacterized protein n=1 Tax=Ilumatobacter fluminis TaxID=467091 RepID=A0A4R7I6U5_9ACTN|nr:hypothetical protein [Ilumatobacter fluminis]TDT18596.1 hypothetical protein BDK89_4223 [Ilumatobacter fluminis]
MAGFMDKLKDTFGKAKDKFDETMDSEQVEKAKAKTKDLAGKATATAKDTYEKVSDKAKGEDKPENISGPEALADEAPTTDTPTAEAAAADDDNA